MEVELSTIIKSYLNWDVLSRYQKISLNFIKKFKTYINWHLVLQYQKLDEDIIIYLINDKDIKLPLTVLIIYQKLSEKFILDYLHLLNIELLIKYQILPSSVLTHGVGVRNSEYLNWIAITRYQPLDLIIKDNLPISKNISLSILLRYRKLTNEFILFNFKILKPRYQKIISKYQNLNSDILFKVDFTIHIKTILKYQRLDEHILHDMIYFYDNIDFEMIQRYQRFSPAFEIKYKSKFQQIIPTKWEKLKNKLTIKTYLKTKKENT